MLPPQWIQDIPGGCTSSLEVSWGCVVPCPSGTWPLGDWDPPMPNPSLLPMKPPQDPSSPEPWSLLEEGEMGWGAGPGWGREQRVSLEGK